MNYGRLHELIQIRHFYGWLNNIFNQVDVGNITISIKGTLRDVSSIKSGANCNDIMKFHF